MINLKRLIIANYQSNIKEMVLIIKVKIFYTICPI